MKKIFKVLLIIITLLEILPLGYFIVTYSVSYIRREKFPPIESLNAYLLFILVIALITLIYHLQTFKLYTNFKLQATNLLDEDMLVNKQVAIKSFKVSPLLWLSAGVLGIHYLLLALLVLVFFGDVTAYGYLLIIVLFLIGISAIGDLVFVYRKINE